MFEDLCSYKKFDAFHFQAKEALTNPEERSLYDAWKSAGIAMSYAQWRSLKSSVKSSMHWATPKTSGRMLEIAKNTEKNDPISLNPSPVKEEDTLEHLVALQKSNDSDEISYDPIPYDKIGFRMGTPPGLFWNEESNSNDQKENIDRTDKNLESEKNKKNPDANTAMRRKQFAVRRQSTIGTMVMADKWDDNEIRRKFRNYEI